MLNIHKIFNKIKIKFYELKIDIVKWENDIKKRIFA